MKRLHDTKNLEIDYLIKTIIVGDSSVGKTSILQHIQGNEFSGDPIPTIGVDIGVAYYKSHDGLILKNQIWDCAGQEKFRSIATSYYRKSNVVFMVFDITSHYSFANLKEWYESLEQNMKLNNAVLLVVGNKSDLESQRAVPKQEANKFAEACCGKYVETSAKNGDNIEQLFKLANTWLFAKYQAGQIELERSIHKLLKKYDFEVENDDTQGCGICNIM